jgi:hypothetical protein
MERERRANGKGWYEMGLSRIRSSDEREKERWWMRFVFDALVPADCATCLPGPVPTPAIVPATALPFLVHTVFFSSSLSALI